MFGLIARSKSTTALLSAAVLASTTLVSGGFAAPMTSGDIYGVSPGESYVVPHDDGIYDGASQNFYGGNASEIPRVINPGAHAMYGAGPMPSRAQIGTGYRAPRISTEQNNMGAGNSAVACDHGYRWDETAANGWTLPMPCHS